MENDREVCRLDVTGENIVITSGKHSNAADVIHFDIFGSRLVTVDRIDDGITRPRDTIRIWKFDTSRWIQETYIARSHVGIISHMLLIR